MKNSKKERIYFMGLVKKNNNTLILQAVTNKDHLSCELWKYFGEFINTKEQLKKDKISLLNEINKEYKTNYKYLLIK